MSTSCETALPYKPQTVPLFSVYIPPAPMPAGDPSWCIASWQGYEIVKVVDGMQGFNLNDVDLSRYGVGQPGAIRRRNGSQYQLTWHDVEYIGKLVWGESMDGDEVHAASVIWTVMQRADIFAPAVTRLGSLAEFIKAFSSPLHGRTTNQRILTARWDEIPVYAKKMAMGFAMGQLPNPIPGSTDFANRNQRVGAILTPVAWIGYRGRTTGNIFFARGMGDGRTTLDYDWTRATVTGPVGTSSTTREAFERYGRVAQTGMMDTLGAMVPGGRAIIRRVTGQ